MNTSSLNDHLGSLECDLQRYAFQKESSLMFAQYMTDEIQSAPTFEEAKKSYRTALDCVLLALEEKESDHHKLNTCFTNALGSYRQNAEYQYRAALRKPSLN